MTYENLSDKVHAIMVEELLRDLSGTMEINKARGMDGDLIKTEEPFNVYGNRGFVDILHYGKWPFDNERYGLNGEQIALMGGDDLSKGVLSIYECKPRITNLNETMRQITKYSEYMIQEFRKRYSKKPVGLSFTNLVLLNTKENCDMILKFENTFLAVFQNKPGRGYFETKNRKTLVLFDPLEDYSNYFDSTRSLAENVALASRLCERIMTIQFTIGDYKDAPDYGVIGETSLLERYHYIDAKDFYERYSEKKGQ